MQLNKFQYVKMYVTQVNNELHVYISWAPITSANLLEHEHVVSQST